MSEIVRAVPGGIALAQPTGTGVASSAPVLVGHFSVYNEWARIDSVREGTFMERIAPGAFADTLREDRAGLRVLFQHGKDPDLGEKPIAVPRVIREDARGAYYEAELLPGLPELVTAGLRAGVYGSSFRFTVTGEDFDPRPGRSIHNPDGIPERTIRSARVREFGPVVWPAYAGASAGIRSLTDEIG